MVKRKTFQYQGSTFTMNPSTEEFFEEMAQAKIMSRTSATRTKRIFLKKGWTTYAHFEQKSYDDLVIIDGVSSDTAKKIINHKRIVSSGGVIAQSFDEQLEYVKNFDYLETHVPDLNLYLFDGENIGFRSRTLIEFYGKPQMGKTQWMYDLAIRCMLPKEEGGWGRSVIYMDTEGAYSTHRLMKAGSYWGLTENDLKKKLYYVRPQLLSTGSDLMFYLDELIPDIVTNDVGLIIVDSLIQPFRSEFSKVTGEGLSTMTSRQSMLGKTLSKLKGIANAHNLIVCYTNHVIANINSMGGPSLVPVGGDTVGHASDLRFYLSKAKSETKMPDRKMKLMDCGWLPSFEVQYMLSEIGILPSNSFGQDILNHYTNQLKIKEKNPDYQMVNHLGKPIVAYKKLKDVSQFKEKFEINIASMKKVIETESKTPTQRKKEKKAVKA